MKIFLSWAGEGSASHQVAQALHIWLPNVIQSLRPWISSEDIRKGARPAIELARELQDHAFGIICVTLRSIDSRWLNFEAGALSKQLANNSIYPFLLRMRPSQVNGPLAGFQQVIYGEETTKEGEVFKLITAINTANGDYLISPQQLTTAYAMWWPRLKEQLDNIKDDAEQELASPQSDSPPALEEVLRILRELQITTRTGESGFVVRSYRPAFTKQDALQLFETQTPSVWLSHAERTKLALSRLSETQLRELLGELSENDRVFVVARFGLFKNQALENREALQAADIRTNHPGMYEGNLFERIQERIAIIAPE